MTSSYVPSWPPTPGPAFCHICETTQEVWSQVVTKDEHREEIDMELKCGHRIVATTRKRGAPHAAA